MRERQKDFFKGDKNFAPHRISYGGETKGSRKLSRPLDHRKPLHLTLKSTSAQGQMSFLSPKNKVFVEKTLRERAEQFGIKIQLLENMGNHIHTTLRFSRRSQFQNFLRTVTALIARFVTGARKGKPFGRKFWDHLAFTRVITSFKDLVKTENYLNKNSIERFGGRPAREAVETVERKRRKLWSAAVASLKKK